MSDPNETPRLLMISDRWFPHVGGSIVWFHNCYMRREPGTVCILTQDYPTADEFDEAHRQFRFYRLHLERYRFLKPESLLMMMKLFFGAIWIILRRRIQVIHVSKVLNEGFVARWLHKVLRRPYIVFAHGEEITVCHGNPRLRPKLVPIYDDAQAVIANSTFTAQLLLDIGCRGDNIVQISPGVDPQAFVPGPRDPELVERFGLEGKKVLLSVGRLQLRKGHDRMIEALPAILERHSDVVYLILSDGEQRAHLEKITAELGVEDAVRFVGEVSNVDLPRFYRTCDVFCLANRQLSDGDVEGFGIVFLEASATEKPVLAGDTGGTCDPARDGWNGRRIDASDAAKIADAINGLLDDPELCERMGKNGRRMVLEEYAWDIVAARVEEVTRQVAEGKPVGTANELTTG